MHNRIFQTAILSKLQHDIAEWDGGIVDAPDVNAWLDEVKVLPTSDSIGMVLVHRGVVRGSSRAGEPVTGMTLSVDRARLDEVLDEAANWAGVVAVRGWVNEGSLSVGDVIMMVLVAGDIRENVFAALELLVSLIKTEVVLESEISGSLDYPI
jgi:molybdopterin synthase catalytic subunit